MKIITHEIDIFFSYHWLHVQEKLNFWHVRTIVAAVILRVFLSEKFPLDIIPINEGHSCYIRWRSRPEKWSITLNLPLKKCSRKVAIFKQCDVTAKFKTDKPNRKKEWSCILLPPIESLKLSVCWRWNDPSIRLDQIKIQILMGKCKDNYLVRLLRS